MKKKYSDDLIIKYLENQLTSKERAQFEADLAQDAELARELEEFQILAELLRKSFERKMLRNKAFHVQEDEKVSEERRKRRQALQKGLENLRTQHQQPQFYTQEKKNEMEELLSFSKTYRTLAASVMLLTIGAGVFLSYQHLKTNQIEPIAYTEPAIPQTKYAHLQVEGTEPLMGENHQGQVAAQIEEIQKEKAQGLVSADSETVVALKSAQKELRTAIAYTEIPDLEALIKEGSYRSSIRLISPKAESHYKDGLLFSWVGELDEEEEEFYLEIYSVALEKPLRLDIPRQNQTFKLDRKLTPQLYYWKLQTENDLIAVGKFKVEAD
jgi:hypothetical protein